MPNAALIAAYRAQRSHRLSFAPHDPRARSDARTASAALNFARLDVAAGRKVSPCGGINAGAAFTVGRDVCRWIENPAAAGMRVVDYADKIEGSGIRHRGWYLDEDCQDEAARGIVFQLSSKRGEGRFLAAIADPCNDGPAIVCVDSMADDATTAARWADSLAERYADDSKAYRAASNARMKFEDLGDEAATHRRSALELIRAIKAHGGFAKPICDALRSHVTSHIRDIRKARAERARLHDSFATVDGWTDY